jgi:flagellar motor protein MotB
VANYRVSGGRLDAKGLGDSKPLGSNETAEGRANNRRVELVRM